jgi:XTP/dITP diphosphohydrolase
VVTLREAGIDMEIPEPFNTLEENAEVKAQTIFELTGTDCFSEDTGLEVSALGGEPGVRSARYASDENPSSERNIEKLLQRLGDNPDRSGSFRTVICLLWKGKKYYFEGKCSGTILKGTSGTGGFGYDPVFQPDGADVSFAEMSIDEKNRYSHRRKAVDKLVAFLNDLSINK